MDTIIGEVRFAVRRLLTAPGITALAVLTLALGIGSTAVVYSWSTTLLGAQIPARDIERIVGLWSVSDTTGQRPMVVSPEDFVEWRRRQQSFEGMTAYRFGAVNLGIGSDALRVGAQFVVAGHLEVLGLEPLLGRGFLPAENDPGNGNVAVLSNRFWQSEFASQSDVLGTEFDVDGSSVTVVGVLPPDDYTNGVLLPLSLDPSSPNYRDGSLFVAGRLHAGIGIEQAREAMNVLGAGLASERPSTHVGRGISTRPYREAFFTSADDFAGLLLAVAAGAILLIGCINVANLLLTRGASRQRELSVRAALGASRRRLIFEQLLEGLFLAVSGAVGGLLVAHWGLGFLRLSVQPGGAVARIVERATIDVEVLWFALLVAVVSTLLFALLPAVRASRMGQAEAARHSVNTTDGRRQRRLRGILVTVEVALTSFLLILSALSAQSLIAARQVEPGFDASNLLTLSMSLSESRYSTDASAVAFFQSVHDGLTSLPAVVAVGGTSRVPIAGGLNAPDRPIEIEGRVTGVDESFAVSDVTVTVGYLEAMRVPVIEGRLFSRNDGAEAARAVVISQAAAATYWGERSPIGARIRFGGEDVWRTVVGVVGDIRSDNLGAPTPLYTYVPIPQRPRREMTLLVKTEGDPLTQVDSIRSVIARIDPRQPLFDVRSMDQVLADDLRGPFVFTSFFNGFAAIGLALAIGGIYGVVSYTTTRRTRELAVRLVVGAAPKTIVRAVVWQGLMPVVAGLVLGLLMALALARGMGTVLYGVNPMDPLTFGSVAVLLIGVGVAASMPAAVRASRLDPVTTLRTH